VRISFGKFSFGKFSFGKFSFGARPIDDRTVRPIGFTAAGAALVGRGR